jgi:anti-sigma regulatory factor (Ser/Thr protein kinase)
MPEEMERNMSVVINLGEVTSQRITAGSSDRVFQTLLADLSVQEESNIRVDLSTVTYMTPSGATWLWTCLRHLKSCGVQILVSPPEKLALVYWLRWMHFFDHLEAEGIECALPAPSPIPPGAVSDALLPMTPIRLERDVSEIVSTALERIGKILAQHLGYDRKDVHNFATVLSETCMNILDHSGDMGMIAVQKYRVKGGRPFVMIGVTDGGCGVRASLSRAHPEAVMWGHETAIRQALERGVSGVPEEDRGLGLYYLARHIRQYQGCFHFRSGDTRLRLKEKDEVFRTAPVVGTQLCITLSTRRESE